MTDQKQQPSNNLIQFIQQTFLFTSTNHPSVSESQTEYTSKISVDFHIFIHQLMALAQLIHLILGFTILRYIYGWVYEYLYRLLDYIAPTHTVSQLWSQDRRTTVLAIFTNIIFIILLLVYNYIRRIQINSKENNMKTNSSIKAKLPISEEKLKELRLKLKKQREEKLNEEFYEPPILTEEYIKEHKLTEDFVQSHEYLRKHYKELSNKYGDKTWFIIDKSGIVDYSEDFDAIYNIFYDKGYAGNAILSQVGKRGYLPMFLCNEKTCDCDLQDFLFDTGSETTTILEEDLKKLNLKQEGVRKFRLANGVQIENPITTLSFSFDEYPDKSFRRQVCVDKEVRLLGMDIILENKFVIDGINKEFIY